MSLLDVVSSNMSIKIMGPFVCIASPNIAKYKLIKDAPVPEAINSTIFKQVPFALSKSSSRYYRVGISRLDISRVNAHGDVSHDTVVNILPIRGNNSHNRVETFRNAIGKMTVLAILAALNLSMRDIGLERHDVRRNILLKVQLAGRDDILRPEGPVSVQRPVRVDLRVDVDGAAGVEARVDRLHLGQALGVGRPHAAEEGCVVGVEVGLAHGEVVQAVLRDDLPERRVGVHARKAGVAARGVGRPDAHEGALEGLARGHVDETDVQPDRHARLALGGVLPEHLGLKPCVWPSGDLCGQDACVVLQHVVIGRCSGDFDGAVAGAPVPLRHPFGVSLLVEASHMRATALGKGAPARKLGARERLAVS